MSDGAVAFVEMGESLINTNDLYLICGVDPHLCVSLTHYNEHFFVNAWFQIQFIKHWTALASLIHACLAANHPFAFLSRCTDAILHAFLDTICQNLNNWAPYLLLFNICWIWTQTKSWEGLVCALMSWNMYWPFLRETFVCFYLKEKHI